MPDGVGIGVVSLSAGERAEWVVGVTGRLFFGEIPQSLKLLAVFPGVVGAGG